MSTRVLDRVEEWNGRPFTDGYRGLQGLADREFSGVVRAGNLDLFMTRGVAVAVRGGDVEAFEGVSGTAYEAPSSALPLLAVMQERSDEVRDRFYTEQTPISTVDETLSEGGFTGYIELSENVLSGDYYLVYHAGTSTSVAFVGQSGRLVDGREAFETADDEVGIYQVRPVDIEPVDLPDPEPRESADSGTATPDGENSTGAESGSPTGAGTDDSATEAGERGDDPGADDGPATESDHVASADSAGEEGSRRESGASGAAETDTGAANDSAASTADTDDEDRPGEESVGSSAGASEAAAATEVGEAVHTTDPELRTIPSVAPGRTVEHSRVDPAPSPDDPTATGQSPQEDTADGSGEEPGESQTGEPAHESEPDQTDTDDETDGQSEPADRSGELQGEREQERDDLRAELDSVIEERDDLRAELDSVIEERDDLRAELDSVIEERDDLRAELDSVIEERDELDARLRDVSRDPDDAATPPAEGTDASGDESGRALTPRETLAETVVFVRYRSQGDVTLKDAHAGSGDQQSLRENLKLEIYGGFEGPITVDGRSYEQFVERTLAYQFLDWVVTELPFEIRETGNRNAIQGLYDALPTVDHADLQGVVDLDGEPEPFDIVFRDQRERPLLVATIASSRKPVTGDQMEQLVTAAERVGTTAGSLQGAFLVTRSYFDGEALDIADEATKSRLLSRDKQKSFVSLSRKQGFHLCLVEAREGSPHLALPEL